MTQRIQTCSSDSTDDTALSPQQVRHGQRLFLVETGLVRLMMASLTGLCLTGLIIELGGDARHVGFMQSAMLLGGVFQVGTNSILTRVHSRKRFCLVALGFVRVLRLGIAALPLLLWLDWPGTLVMYPLGALLFVGAVFGMSAEVVRQSWIADLVPVGVRGRFFGWRAFIGGFVLMVAVPAYGWFADFWKDTGGEGVYAFQILIAFGAGSGFASLWCVWRVPEPPMHRASRPTSLARSIALPFRHGQFRWFIALHSSFSFAAGFCGGFFHYFMYTFLGMSYWLMSWTDFVTHLVGLAAAPTWGKLADRWGTKRMLTVALVAKAIFPFLWLAILPRWWYLVFAVVVVRLFNTAQEIGFVNLGLNLAPEADRAAYISVYRGCNNLARAIAPALAGALAALIGDRVWQVGPVPVTALHVLIIISGVLRLGSLFWLRKIREPNHVALTEVAEDEDLYHD